MKNVSANNLNISSHLYVSESLKKKQHTVIQKILNNKKVLRLYVITNAANTEDQLDIYYYNKLFQNVFRKYYHFTVYGIAKSHEEAMLLIEQIANDCYVKQGDLNLNRFLTD